MACQEQIQSHEENALGPRTALLLFLVLEGWWLANNLRALRGYKIVVFRALEGEFCVVVIIWYWQTLVYNEDVSKELVHPFLYHAANSVTK